MSVFVTWDTSQLSTQVPSTGLIAVPGSLLAACRPSRGTQRAGWHHSGSMWQPTATQAMMAAVSITHISNQVHCAPPTYVTLVQDKQDTIRPPATTAVAHEANSRPICDELKCA
jgi:hypothetical protein